jgi:hypothetical protein
MSLEKGGGGCKGVTAAVYRVKKLSFLHSLISGGSDGRIHVYDLQTSSKGKYTKIEPVASVSRLVNVTKNGHDNTCTHVYMVEVLVDITDTSMLYRVYPGFHLILECLSAQALMEPFVYGTQTS